MDDYDVARLVGELRGDVNGIRILIQELQGQNVERSHKLREQLTVTEVVLDKKIDVLNAKIDLVDAKVAAIDDKIANLAKLKWQIKGAWRVVVVIGGGVAFLISLVLTMSAPWIRRLFGAYE